ncbi:MAG TPA: metallophosphoesterase [Planctomycetota bacterium]|nr:metallophosphoesterase [Planctomycetota bacterium]
MKRKVARIVFASIVGLAAALAAGWQAFCYQKFIEVKDMVPPANFGNWERNQRLASGQESAATPDEFRFVVAGDSRGYGTFESLMTELKKLKPDFLILLGDIARHGTEADHEFLQLEMTTEMQTDFPIFYVVGNHDIVPAYPPDVWQKAYGPAQCSFMRNGNLFILAFIPNDDPQAEIGVRFVEKVLEEQGPHAKRIFLFNHVPPRISPDSPFQGFPHQNELLDLLVRHEVDYFIAGDYHSYACVRLGSTNIIVSGGAGADLRGGSFGFHHAVVFDVNDKIIHERLCVVPKLLALEDRLESEAITACIPFIARHPFVVAAADIALLAMAVMASVNAVPKLRRRFRMKGR